MRAPAEARQWRSPICAYGAGAREQSADASAVRCGYKARRWVVVAAAVGGREVPTSLRRARCSALLTARSRTPSSRAPSRWGAVVGRQPESTALELAERAGGVEDAAQPRAAERLGDRILVCTPR